MAKHRGTAVWDRECEVPAERRWLVTTDEWMGWTGLPNAWPSVLRMYLEAVEMGDRVVASLYGLAHNEAVQA